MARAAVKGTQRRTAAQIAEASEMLGGSVGAVVGSLASAAATGRER